MRVFHWSLALSVAVAWVTGDGGPKIVHHWAGYVAAALIAIRLVWGLIGSRHARFASFVRSPGGMAASSADIARGAERRFVGHNPAGGAMIVALLCVPRGALPPDGFSTTDMFFGVDWIEELHQAMSKMILVLIGLHLLGSALPVSGTAKTCRSPWSPGASGLLPATTSAERRKRRGGIAAGLPGLSEPGC